MPYVGDNPNRGGLNSPSENDSIAGMIREGVEAWQPRRGPDWPDVLMRIAGSGPPALLLYSAASLALVVILVAAFLIGSYLQIGALAPQGIPANLP